MARKQKAKATDPSQAARPSADWSFPATLISEDDRQLLGRQGLPVKGIYDLGWIVLHAQDTRTEYAKPAEVRAAIDSLKGTVGPLRAAVDACPSWAAEIIEGSLFVARKQNESLVPFEMFDIKSKLASLEAAVIAAARSRTVTTTRKGKADVKRSVARQVAGVMERHGFQEQSGLVPKAIDAVLEASGFKVARGRDGESTARQFLKPEKSGQK